MFLERISRIPQKISGTNLVAKFQFLEACLQKKANFLQTSLIKSLCIFRFKFTLEKFKEVQKKVKWLL